MTAIDKVGEDKQNQQPTRKLLFVLLLLSAATLVFEINLTRLFSVAQFYHFAFMIVSLALLGYGASGTALSIFPKFGRQDTRLTISWLALGCGLSMLGAYLLTNWLPFDSFRIAWDRRQIFILVLHYLALALPFFFSGMVVGLLFAAYPQVARVTYAANLLGSALGCGLALISPASLGGEGTVTYAAGLAVVASILDGGYILQASWKSKPEAVSKWRNVFGWTYVSLCLLLILFATFDLTYRLSGKKRLTLMELRLSPYKSLSYALQYPDAKLVSQRWNSFSRVDVVQSGGIRSLPGLSFTYLKPLPKEDGLFVDGDDLSAIVLPKQNLDFTDYLPGAIAFHLRPGGRTLVLDARGGMDILTALYGGARQVTAVEVNPLIIEAASTIYQDERVNVVVETGRSYLQRTNAQFDVIILSLTSSYHPVRSGAYSLAEDYRYTEEAFRSAISHLDQDGILIVTRWLQMPPSEFLRAFALAIDALQRLGLEPVERLVAFRGYNLGCLLVKKAPFTQEEMGLVRAFAKSRSFDLVYSSDILINEINQYNILSEEVYYRTFTELISAPSPEKFYAAYAYDIRPPSDDHPFFGHYFKWSQAGQILAEFGKTWQPFGGAGYFVIIALLLLVVVLSAGLICLPVFVFRQRGVTFSNFKPNGSVGAILLYFAMIGLAYLLVEIPLVQRFILYLGHPAYALIMVLFSLLLFSGLGSWTGFRIPLKWALLVLVLVLLLLPTLLTLLFEFSLGFSLGLRLVISILVLSPIGYLMGMAFPTGIARITSEGHLGGLITWVWAINGAASVIAAVLAALFALTFGFGWVLRIGALCYAIAWLTDFTLKVKVSSLVKSLHP